MIFADKALSQKIEHTEARSGADFVEARAVLYPDVGAKWIEVSGTYALFDGTASPITQTYGLGLFEKATHAELDKIEAFYKENEAPVFHEVSPIADPSTVALLGERGYLPIELTSVMYRPLVNREIHNLRANPKISTRIIADHEVDHWAQTRSMAGATRCPNSPNWDLSFRRSEQVARGLHRLLPNSTGYRLQPVPFVCMTMLHFSGAQVRSKIP